MLQTVQTFNYHREEYDLDRKDFFYDNRHVIVWGGILFIILLLLRSWTNFSQPGLYAEDSVHYFNLFYGDTASFAHVFNHPNGYYNIFNNLIAFLTSKIDITLQPLVYQLVAMCLCLITLGAFSLSGLIKSRYVLFIAPFLLGFSGLNHFYYYTTLTFQMYIVVVLLLILLFWQSSDHLLLNGFYFLCVSFLIWSGPYSVLAVPFCLCFIVLFRGKTGMCLLLIGVTVAYTLSVSKSTIMLQNLLNAELMLLWGKVLVTNVFFMGFKDSVNIERLLIVFSTLSFLLVYLRKDPLYLRTAALFGAIIVSSFAPFMLSKKYLMYQTFFPCHILIAQFFWLAFLLYSIDKIILRQEKGRHFSGICIISICCIFIFIDNRTHTDKYKVPVLKNFPEFLQTIKEAEAMELEKKKQNVVIVTNGTGMFKAKATVGDQSPLAVTIKEVVIK